MVAEVESDIDDVKSAATGQSKNIPPVPATATALAAVDDLGKLTSALIDDEGSTISSIASELQREMKDYIEMRMEEAKREATREFLTSVSVKHGSALAAKGASTSVVDPQIDVKISPVEIAIATEIRTIHHSKMKDLSAHVITYIQSKCIHDQKQKRGLLRDIYVQLASVKLLTMLNKQRKVPPTKDKRNPTGFVAGHFASQVHSDADDDTDSIRSETSILAENMLYQLQPPNTWIPDDNTELYEFDKGKLLVLVRVMFHKQYWVFGEKEYRSHDPVGYYDKLYAHVFGKKAKDLHDQQQQLLRFKPDTTQKFIADYHEWNNIMDEIREITGADIPEKTLQSFLDLHYTNDPRTHISGALDHARNENWDFTKTIKQLCEADDRAPNIPIKHMYGLSNTNNKGQTSLKKIDKNDPPRYCHRFQEGNCPRGEKCRYIHEIAPPGALNVPPLLKNQKTKETVTIPVTKQHRKEKPSVTFSNDYKDDPDWHPSIGYPAGRFSDHNPYAYSKSQRANIKFMKANPTEASNPPSQDARKPFSSWKNEPPSILRKTDLRAMRLKRKYNCNDEISDIESDSDRAEQNQSPTDLEAEPSILQHDRPRSQINEDPIVSIESHNASLRRSTCQFVEIRRHEVIPTRQPPVYVRSIDGNFNEYNNAFISARLKRQTSVLPNYKFNLHIVAAYHKTFEYYIETPYVRGYNRAYPSASINPITFLFALPDPPALPNTNAMELCLFGHNSDTTEARYTRHLRQDVIRRSPAFMNLIYAICETLFGAITKRDVSSVVINVPDFSISNCRYTPSNQYGHYTSQMHHFSDYVEFLDAICFMDYSGSDNTSEVYTDTLILALIWDFQAWVAQVISSVHFSVKGISYLRWLIVKDIMECNHPRLKQLQLSKVFIYLALHVAPFDDETTICYSNGRYLRKYEHAFHGELTLQNRDTETMIASCNITTHYLYGLQSYSLNAVREHQQRFIIDTGASVSATSNSNLLNNLQPCNDMIAYPAFGPQIKPTLRGEFGHFGLDTVVIEDMPDTLISVSQLCEGGKSQKQNVAVFTTEGVRVFQFDSIRKALQIMDASGIEVLRGLTEDGVYVTTSPVTSKQSHRLFLAKFRPISLYDHIHQITGHPGDLGMKWHKENSLNGKYTDSDINRHRGVCHGCVYGALHQTPTDPHRDHRSIPVIPGQCFALDAYTHTTVSSRGHLYCDIFTDLATRRHYPVFTKDRSAHELCEKTRQLFIKHPEWSLNASRAQPRFIRLDSESNYKSIEFLTFANSIKYTLEYTPVRDKHAGGVAERAVGVISAKTNIAMMSCTPPVPQFFWDYAMQYACDTHSYNFSSVIGTSPYMKITGQPVNLKYLQPFWSSCYVFIPLKDRYKVGDPRAYKAHFVGYANTTLMFPNYIVIPVTDNNRYSRHKESKDVIFDPTINFNVYTQDEEPYDREFVNTDHYIPFLDRVNAPDTLKGPHATPNLPDESEVYTPISPQRSTNLTYTPANRVMPNDTDDTDANINRINAPYEDESGSPIYWYQFHVRNYEYPLAMCETQNFYKVKLVRDLKVPQNYYKAMQQPVWAAAIDKELTKFEKNMCLQLVPYNGQHRVPMMWTFTIKTDGTKKARLVGRGDLMIPNVDFDPNAVYCGNVTACSIKICVTIAAKYKLDMKGGDLEGAYLVTRSNPDYAVFIHDPQGYEIPKGMCIQAIGNLYGFPPAGQNFSLAFDKCVTECGYKNTPWDLKFFYKWKNNKPMLLIVHSDDFRWFGDARDMSEWQLLVDTFEKHKYKVSDVTDNEFVGIQITRDDNYNYFMNQMRMIDDILSETQMKQAKDKRLPYPLQGPPLSKLDNATEANYAECQKFPYRRIVGQLMYGMVHTLVTIAYALNVLSRYGNNPGPRHIEFLIHLVKYVRSIKYDRLKFETHTGPMDIATMTKELQLRFQCDADLAGNPDTLHSQTSYLGYLGTSLICWGSTDQGSMATSTAESEIKAVNHTLKSEVIANRGILSEMGWVQRPTIIEEDNKACVDASNVSHMTRGLRHLAITENYIKEKSMDGTCELKKIDSANNNADIGTKRLQFPIFDYLTFPLTDRSLRPVKQCDMTEKKNAK